MSYCRFSSDDFWSDIYCYCSGRDEITIHVASRRLVLVEPMPPPLTLSRDDEGWPEACVERIMKVHEIVDRSDHVPITLPNAGKTYICANAAEAAIMLRSLGVQGFNVPLYAIEELEQEAADGTD